ncbi:cell surface protein SprA [Aggregatimonas sangjinii]|uniref:Cell surface protein SprA n=1 Tax=Aggregatimonas sangjinii TaxID=2583587 RepID=A0A5B7SVM3_9FLAO|nr:cell surface protein SprA [Aggregatimonas sangjinii]QCX01203.1 cell surface protein SprA [Aggregatimonas sangjinii]
MKTGATTILKFSFKLTILFALCFLGTGAVNAQDNPTEQEQDSLTQQVDSVKTGFDLGKILLENPDSIVSKYIYDPKINGYVYSEKLGDFDIGYPIILTPEQYYELARKEGMKAYFKEKADAFSGKKEGSEEARKNLLPNFYVNNKFFESIFGGTEIQIDPQGSVAMDLGVIWQKNDNPALSPRNRSNLSFDFDQRISLSMLGTIGTRLQANVNYDTEATFDFQNIFKIDYTPTDDDIIRKIEFGNVNMPLNSSLIQGAQSLFGVKTQLQFGKTTVTAVFSQQQSQNNTVVAQGGGTINDFSLSALDYDEDKHFFLGQYFRDNYDTAMESYPYIRSQVQITRLEVWVTNRNQQTLNVRNIVALQDLGEALSEQTRLGNVGAAAPGFFNTNPATGNLPRNNANDYDPALIASGSGALNDNIRDIATVDSGFNSASFNAGYSPSQGTDFAILENARKLEQGRDYDFNTQLGYISLNQRLSNDEVLGVAYQYTFNGNVYQVGEFANGGLEATTVQVGPANPIIDNNTLILKLLKSNITNISDPIWDLMMKNIYATGAFQLSQEDFKMNILYSDPTPRNYITPVDEGPGTNWPEGLEEDILLNVFNLDRLNVYNDLQPGGDGFFDFVPGLTVDTRNGRIIFTKAEPFGGFLYRRLNGGSIEGYGSPENYDANQEKYVFRDMYELTKAAALQDPEKNKFILKGRYKSEGSNGIPIGAFNVPRGSVRVTAGGRTLQEGIDYTVNYQAGTVQILDPNLEASNVPINISVENNAVFGQQTRNFTGINVEHQVNKNFVLGGTLLKLNERPLTQKSNFGVEPVNNTIFGFNGNFSTEVPFLTRMVNKLPNIDTDVPSNLSLRGEVAWLKPGSPKNADFQGETTTYLDDFEGAQALIDIRSSLGWTLASIPTDRRGPSGDPLGAGFNRAKVAWYTIDPIFYTSQRPASISDSDISLNESRRIFIDEVFPRVEVAQGQTQQQTTFDLAYYPTIKGPYNANTEEGFTDNPQENWGGVMRSLNSTNFEQANVEFIQFWVMDPYEDNVGTTPGKLVIELGNISEDILPDGRKQYENGLPVTEQDTDTRPTDWGEVPQTQALVYAFDVDEASRTAQDVGLDGLADVDEGRYGTGPDPANDNYEYFLQREGSILNRYLNFNNTEGNSPIEVTNDNRGNTTLPDVEDIDRDLTMNTIDSYYRYEVEIKPGTNIGDQYVTDIRDTLYAAPRIPDGSQKRSRWIQYKIPLSDITEENTFGGISDLRSVSTMRMYLTDFTDDVVLRFATLDLVRGDWRTYTKSLEENGDLPSSDATSLDVNAVNIQENEQRSPIRYVLPPDVIREPLNNNNTVVRQNEQSLSLVVNNLEPEDSRAVFKSLNIDLRQYEKIKMFMHAEEVGIELRPSISPLVGFLRIGTDFSENFYQIELPLQFTEWGAISPRDIWPEANEMDVLLDDLKKIKSLRINLRNDGVPLNETRYYEIEDGEPVEKLATDPRADGRLRIGIKGNPSLGNIRSMMVGIKNISDRTADGEVWFNELRLAGLDNKGGWASVVAMDANIADFANITATGSQSTSGFGAIDQMPNERAREDAISYDVVTNLNLGQLLPPKWGIQLPFNYGISEQLITPEFDPEFDDLRLEDLVETASSEEDAENIRERAEDYTKRTSINLIGVRKNRGEEADANFYDIENFTFNYSYNQTDHRDFEVEDLKDQSVVAGFVYNHNFKPVEVAPFAKKDSLFNGRYWQWLKELNLSLLPTTISVNSDINRQFNRQTFRNVIPAGEDPANFLSLPELQQRNYLFNWQYTVNYSLTKSLRLNFIGSNNNIVRNYLDDPNNPESEVDKALRLWDGFWDLGEPNRHSQQMQLNYEIPFAKIPALDFIDAQYSYTSNFDWQRGGDALNLAVAQEQNPGVASGELDIVSINTVQNANTHNLTASLTMQKFYDLIGLKKRSGKSQQQAPVKTDKAGNNEKEKKKTPAKTSKLWNTAVDIVTMVKRLNVNYNESNGTVLPGYTQSVGFIGSARPTIGFVFGSQADVRFDAARNGWLTGFDGFNEQFIRRTTKQLNITATAQPVQDLTIDLVADRQFSESLQENYQIDIVDGEQQYVPQTPNNFGNFSISTMMIGTAFGKSDEFDSENFEEFKQNRITIANRIISDRAQPFGTPDEDGFPERYGKTSQDVLLPAFFAAYTGQSADRVNLDIFRSIPIPNWNIKYTGLMRNKWFKKKFTRFSLQHGYRAAYSINSFQTNLEKQQLLKDDLGAFNPENGDLLPDLILNNVVLNDAFNPLLRVDFEMKNSVSVLAEVRTDRTLSLSLDNNLMTEINGKEYTLGLGYRIKDVKFVTNIGGNKTRLKGDLNLKADLSLRDNITIIRNLDIDNNQITSGQNLLSIKFTADYALTKNLNALFFYDHSFSQFAVSTAFPQTTINSGFTLRYNFGN